MRRLWPALAFVSLLAVIVRLAWLSDDAYITLRMVDNFVNGHGLVWNAGERVQPNVHPLWTLLLVAGRVLTGECYFTTMWIGILLSAVVALWLMRFAGGAPEATAVAVLLLSSRAFTDFATAGLENPLSHLMLVPLIAVTWFENDPRRRYARTALLTSLAACTRIDLLVLATPLLLAAARGVGWGHRLRWFLLGIAPFAAWLSFATIYYGSPLPVTAYAKALAHGVPLADLALQGLRYFVASTLHDPATTLVIVAGLGVGLTRPALQSRWLAIAAIAYCVYVVRIGGDFMSGRLLLPPFVMAVAILARLLGTAPARWSWLASVATLGAMLLGGLPVWCRAPDDEPPPTMYYHGIVDERAVYAASLGLWSGQRSVPVAGFRTAFLRANKLGPLVVPWAQVGRYGFESGDLFYIVDAWLADPLMMRLPLVRPEPWRIGHFERRAPEGYFESLATGENRILHPGLRRFYEALRTSLRAPVFAQERLRAVWDLLRGAHDDDLRAYIAEQYRAPPRIAVDAAELAVELPIGSFWYSEPRIRVVYPGGLDVRWREPVQAKRLRVQVFGVTDYFFSCRHRGTEVANMRLTPTHRWEQGLQEYHVDLPESAGPFDSIWIDGITGATTVAAIGGLALVR